MRGTRVEGRFKVDFEKMSMEEGVVDELGTPVGTAVEWYIWDKDYFAANPSVVVDDIYDVSNQTNGQGRKWKDPFSMPVIMGQLMRSTNILNERGFYVSDTLRIVLAVADVERLLPAMLTDPSSHIRDRIVFADEVFVPTRVLPRGRYKNYYSVITLDCNQTNPEEMVNDVQFQQYTY